MKKYSFLILTAAVLTTTAALSGCDKDPETILEVNHLRLSDNSFSFDAAGNNTYTVTVESSTGDWAFVKEGDWMTVERPDGGNTLTVTAIINETTAERIGTVTITNVFTTREIAVNQLGQGEPGAPKFRVLTEYKSFTISPGGKTGLGCVDVAMDEMATKVNTYVYTIDLATDVRTELKLLENDSQGYSAGAISDDGGVVIIHGNNDNKSKVYDADAKTWNAVAAVAADDTSNCVTGISSDGSIWVGYRQMASSASDGRYRPLKWIGGAPQELSYLTGTNIWGDPIYSGTMVRGCSSDGSVLFGALWDHQEPVYWKPDGSCALVAEELRGVHKIKIKNFLGKETEVDVLFQSKIDANNIRLSSNGKWLAANYLWSESVGTKLTRLDHVQPLLFNMETGEYTLIESENIKVAATVLKPAYSNGGGIGITDNGTLFYGQYRNANAGGGIINGFAYDPASKASVPTATWIQSEFGIYTAGEYWVRKDYGGGKTVLGYKIVPSMMSTVYLPWYATTEGVN